MLYNKLSSTAKRTALKEMIKYREYFSFDEFAIHEYLKNDTSYQNIIDKYNSVGIEVDEAIDTIAWHVYREEKFPINVDSFVVSYNNSINCLQNEFKQNKIFKDILGDKFNIINKDINKVYEDIDYILQQTIKNIQSELSPYTEKIISYIDGDGYTQELLEMYIDSDYYGEPIEFNSDGTINESMNHL